MHLSSAVTIPTLLFHGAAMAAREIAADARHVRAIAHAQSVVNRVAAEAHAANSDYHALLDELRAARLEASTWKAAYEEADAEALRLSEAVGLLRQLAAV